MLPLCSVTALHLLGRCHGVSYGSRRWWGPHEPCSRGRGMASHSPCPCTVRPSFSGMFVGSRFSPSFTYRTPLSLSLLYCRRVTRTAPCPVNLAPSFLFLPHSSSLRERTMVMLFPTSYPTGAPLHVASVFGVLRHHLRLPAYKCHLACRSSIPPPELK
jgi:hypothetical protein